MILNSFVSENLKKKLTQGHGLRNVRNRIYTDVTNTMNRNLETLGGGTSSKEQVLCLERFWVVLHVGQQTQSAEST